MLAAVTLILDIFRIFFLLLRPGGKSALMAECLLIRQQLLVTKRKQRRSPNLTTLDRIVFAVTSLFISPTRLPKLSLVVAHSTLLRFHKALVDRKYSRLFSSGRRKPGPKGPSPELIRLIVEIKQKNPSYGCPRIALLASKLTGQVIDEFLVRRILRKHYHFPIGDGPSWLSAIGNAKDTLWSLDLFCCESIFLKTHWAMIVMDQYTRSIVGFAVHAGTLNGEAACFMFNSIRHGKNSPKYLSTDNDGLFRFSLWQANLELFGIKEIKTVPDTPLSHPFIERLIGTTRREFLDGELFWNEHDLQKKLERFMKYYNSARVHYSLDGLSPQEKSDSLIPTKINLKNYSWKSYCGGRYSIPCAA